MQETFMKGIRLATQGLAALLAIAACASSGRAQPTLGGRLSAGYAAGVDSPVLADGAMSAHAAVWLNRRSGAEFGVAIGRDQFEDRRLVTGALFFNPVSGGVGTATCAGCVAGSAEQRTRMSDWYVTPTITLRRRSGLLQPYATLAAGAYQIHEVRDNRFLPSSGAAAVGASTFTTRKWTAGGSVTLGARVPLGSRIALDVASQLHGAALIGNDYAGGTGYGVLALGISVR
jgi:hypothetical protein